MPIISEDQHEVANRRHPAEKVELPIWAFIIFSMIIFAVVAMALGVQCP